MRPPRPPVSTVTAVTPVRCRITGGFWKRILETVRSRTIPFVFNQCENAGRLENFLIAGGKQSGAARGKMPFDDSDVYKFVEGASLALTRDPDPRLDALLDRVIEIIGQGQEADGYLTTWFSIDRRRPPVPWVDASSGRWTGEASSHELYNSGHLFEAAVAHHRATGKRSLLAVALKNADLLTASFGPGRLTIPPGHQIVEQGLLSLYRLTDRRPYLDLARFFLEWRGRRATHPLYGAYSQDHRPVARQRVVVGHAVRAMYLYAGMTDYALLTGDSAYRRTLIRLWQDLVRGKLYLTGGLGARHEQEALGERFELPNRTAYCETCAAIGSVSWHQRLFQLAPRARYYDVLEYTLYNGVLAGLGLDGESFFYVNPLEADGEFPFNHESLTRLPWFDCPCCPSNLVRFLPSLPGLVYAQQGDILYVNLYAASRVEFRIENASVVIEQRTDYPWQGSVRFTVSCDMPRCFSLRVRLPAWTGKRPFPGGLYHFIDGDRKQPALFINGRETRIQSVHGYASVEREWRQGDDVELRLPLGIRRVAARGRVTADRGLAALTRGPLVYCVENVDHNGSLDTVRYTEGMTWKAVPCDRLSSGLHALVGTPPAGARGDGVYAVPYFAWANRGAGAMKVWLPR